jgi:hypothetical protein
MAMATVRHLEHQELGHLAPHTETNCTYTVVKAEGETYLQIDTYGSPERQIEGKKSQSIRFSQEAIAELIVIIDRYFR